MSAVEKFTQFYQQLEPKDVCQLNQLYDENVVFIDPVAKHTGLAALQDYFDRLLKHTDSCRFDIKCVSDTQPRVFVSWQMLFIHPRLNSGKQVTVNGVTELEFKLDKVVFHRDYYDLGEMLYENIPVLGALVRLLKKRLGQ